MKMVAVVPARKASKRLADKNVKPLLGKPLIEYTIDAIQAADVFDRIIVTTDDPRIHALFQNRPLLTMDTRPPELATDDVQCAQVLHYVIEKYRLQDGFDYLCMLLPTCPLRNSDHIRESFEIVKENNPDSVVSVKKYDFPPQFALELTGSRLVKRWTGIVRTDGVPAMYHPNGAIIWLRIDRFRSLNKSDYYMERTFPYIMDWKSSVDIDDSQNFELAEMILSRQQEIRRRSNRFGAAAHSGEISPRLKASKIQ